MAEPVKLYCTHDEDHNTWIVWFPHPMGGMYILESFDNENDAKTFHQEQLDSADY
jgi:hypothetical protein